MQCLLMQTFTDAVFLSMYPLVDAVLMYPLIDAASFLMHTFTDAVSADANIY